MTVVTKIICKAVLLLLAPLYVYGTPVQDGPMTYIYNGPESGSDIRYRYHWSVLRAALDATANKWGAYTLRPSPFMNESRQIVEMQSARGLINTMVLDTTAELERRLLPVRIPVDKGLLGYRVFLIRKTDQGNFSKVQTLDDLRQFRIGQGSDWSDTSIFRAAGFTVITGHTYEGLFSMLEAGRFDAFGRGVTEVLPELAGFRVRAPSMTVERNLLLYYPMPVYFWFPKTEDGARRAERVEEGMRIILAQGTLDKLFMAEYAVTLKRLNLRDRRLLKMENPLLPNGNPFASTDWLFEPTRQENRGRNDSGEPARRGK